MKAAPSLSLAVALAAAPGAWGFPVEVGQVASLLDVEVTATALERSAVIKVVNRDTVTAECELRIDSGPDEQLRKVRVPPASSKVITQNIRPNTQRVRIEGVCR